MQPVFLALAMYGSYVSPVRLIHISQHHYMGFMCLPIHIYRVYGSVCLQIFCMAVHTVMILAPGLYKVRESGKKWSLKRNEA
jgi:hypothetical protein